MTGIYHRRNDYDKFEIEIQEVYICIYISKVVADLHALTTNNSYRSRNIITMKYLSKYTHGENLFVLYR